MNSIEWLESRIKVLIPEDIGSQLMFKSNIEKAKEKHREEITHTWDEGKFEGRFNGEKKAEQYYKEKFNKD